MIAMAAPSTAAETEAAAAHIIKHLLKYTLSV